MGDPDLRSDEMVLLRTQEVYVKSIPFEGILTNKRILLVDRAKNLLPPKEIPLATIKDVDGGENAIRDPVVTVTVITRTGETRQMVLTFTRTAGGNRSREREEWVKTLKENVSSSFEQVIRKVNPGLDLPQGRSIPVPSPRIEVKEARVHPTVPSPVPKKGTENIHPVKKIIENAPSSTHLPAKEADAPTPGLGTFCSRCGHKVPKGSGFCNRCGSSIIQPGSTSPQPAVPDGPALGQRSFDRNNQKIEPLIERSSVKLPADQQISIPLEPQVQKTAPRPYSPLYDNPPESVLSLQPPPVVTAPQQKSAEKSLIPRLFSSKEISSASLNPASLPPQKPRDTNRMPGKKVFMAIGAIILLILIAVAVMTFVSPMISGSESPVSGSPTVVPATSLTPVPSGTFVIPKTTTAPAVPPTGVYAHISYLGGWKGTYGMPAALQTVINSGDRFFEIENATGPVQVTIEKLDSSTRHELVVEIYKNGGLLTSGKTSEMYGKVKVSADATTGVAQVPQIVTGNVSTSVKPVTSISAIKTTTLPATNSTR
jgi:hypothetical protein